MKPRFSYILKFCGSTFRCEQKKVLRGVGKWEEPDDVKYGVCICDEDETEKNAEKVQTKSRVFR